MKKSKELTYENVLEQIVLARSENQQTFAIGGTVAEAAEALRMALSQVPHETVRSLQDQMDEFEHNIRRIIISDREEAAAKARVEELERMLFRGSKY